MLLNTLLDTFGWAFILPVLPKLHELHGIQHATVGAMMSSVSAISFVIGPVLCRASDSYGRIPFLLLNSLAALIGLLICIYSSTPLLFIIGRILPALLKCGVGVLNAYVSDISGSPAEMTTNMGRLQVE